MWTWQAPGKQSQCSNCDLHYTPDANIFYRNPRFLLIEVDFQKFFSTWCTSFQDFRTFEVISSLTAWVNSIFRPQQKSFLFSCPEQLVTDSLTDSQYFYFWHYRVTQESCDLWSEWWGDMTWPKNLPSHLPTNPRKHPQGAILDTCDNWDIWSAVMIWHLGCPIMEQS